MLELGIVPAASLAPLAADEVPADFAAIGTGEAKSGGRILVAFSPNSGSHAALAALAVGGRLAETEQFDGELWAVAPEWTGPGRRVLGLTGELPYRLSPISAPSLAANGGGVAVEPPALPAVATAAQIAGHLARPADRELFLRAARGLEGLAAKHGGALRGCGRAVEFVLLARCVGELRAEDDGVVLVTSGPQRSTVRLSPDSLSNHLDGFEGQLRKRLNDRRVRESEDGFRSNAIAAFRAWHSLRALVPWPLGGADGEVIDWVGVDVEGRPVIGAVRELLGLAALADILEGAHRLQSALPVVLAHAAPPVVLDAPRLVVGGREISTGLHRVLDALQLSHELFEVRAGGSGVELNAVAAGEAPRRERPARRRPDPRPPREDVETESDAVDENEGESESEEVSADAESGGEGRGGARGRGRGRRRSRRGRGRRDGRDGREGRDGRDRDDSGRSVRDDGESDDDGDGDSEETSRPAPRFEEVSLFDLDDEPSERESGGGRSRRRGRGRRRGRSGSGDEGRGNGGAEELEPSGSDAPGAPHAGSSRDEVPADSADDADDSFLADDDLELEDLTEDVPDFEEVTPEPRYEDDEEEEEEDEAEGQRSRDREQRRQGRRGPAPEVVVDAPRLPRRRAAILACADRDSLAAAILIARDIRMVEGLWVYPQSELMSFFRGVTTDLRDDTPIYVVGFTPSPARDVLQAASLYRDRLQWFDHHEWPPEDLQGLRDAIGADAVHVVPGCGSSLPPVLEVCSRRSRFTDKLVDLMAARFTQHDYERWGRLWWWRLGEIAKKTGDRRAEIDLLLSGRPSDLARDAARVETPPIPAEVQYVSARDFRLVHFAGYGLVVVEVPAELDLHLTARVVRERYAATLSLAYRPDGEEVVFGGDELAGRRSLDLGALVEHVTDKLEGVERLPDDDHVARMRVRDRANRPDRLDDIVAEIAMGRSILER